MTLIAAIGSLLAIILLFVERFMSVKAEKRKLAEQAKKDLENAQSKDDTSGITSAVDAINRL